MVLAPPTSPPATALIEGPTKTDMFSAMVPELRRKAIDEAHAALLSTTPASPTQLNPGNSKAKAKRRQTAHGRIEGGEDIYAFNASEGDDDFHPDSESKKRKRPSLEKKAARVRKNDEGDGYEEGTRLSKKKPAPKRAKSISGGMSVLDLLNDTSEDDWRPNTSKPPTSGKRSTRNNTVDTELLPPLPKPKRKPREAAKTTVYYEPQKFDDNLTLNFNSGDLSNTHSAEIQVAATHPTPQAVASTFMIDLTNDELVLRNERRAEYHALSPEVSTVESLQDSPATNLNGVYDTPDLLSTIPDPPYPSNLLPSQIAIHLAQTHAQMPESHPLAPPSVASDSPLSSLENSPETKPAKKKPKEKKRAATDQHLGLENSVEGDHGFGNFPVASEWRAAKGKARQGMAQATYAGRAKTSNAIDLLGASGVGGSEDDDMWAGDGKAAQKKKKPAVKKRKSTANDGGDDVIPKAKPKRKKSKPIETLVIGDTEDELSGGSGDRSHDLLGTVQVAATASAESLLNPPAEKRMIIKLNINQKDKVSEDELHGSIAVNNPIPPTADNQLDIDRPPGLGAGTKKPHRWGRPKFLDEPKDGVDSSPSTLVCNTAAAAATVHIDTSASVESVSESLPEPTIKAAKKETAAAKRRKSKKDESEEEDWTGDPEPARKPAAKKETRPKTPRVTKKAAAAAAKEAKEQKEKEKAQLSPETIRGSGNEEDVAPVAVVSELELEPVPVKKAPTKKEASKATTKKGAKVNTTSKETVSDAEDEEEDKRDNATPAPESKPETKEEPQTPSKKLAEKVKKTPHSPISKGPVKFRVGLSRRAHIEPLLKIIRK